VNFSLVKTATDEHADRMLEREARWLRELEAVPQLEGQVPRVLKEGTAPDGRRYLVLSVAASKGQTRAFTADHARFLAKLGKARFRAGDFEVSGCCQGLGRALRSLEGEAAPATLATLEGAYRDCETALLYWTGPYVLSQGDFAPWNIRLLGALTLVYLLGAILRLADPRSSRYWKLVEKRSAWLPA
jgi:hypothetical protein